MNLAFEMSRREAMTSTQRRVWLACSGDLDCMAQSVTRGLEIVGALDVERLRECLLTLQHSHACLRTHFVVADGEVWQQIDADTPLDFAVLEVQPGEAGGIIDGVCLRRYDLSAGPLFACRVLRLSAERHLVLLNAHPIVLDGDACAGLLRALGLAYGGQAGAGAPAPATMAPEQLRQFWHEQLAGAAPLMTFPTDVPRPARMACSGSLVRLPIAAPLAGELRALCAQQQCEPEDLLLGVYQVFLYRYSGQADCIVGAALRHGGEAEDAPWTGRGANVMPRRQLLAPQLPFTELLARNKTLREQLTAHGQYQLEEMLTGQLSEHNESHALIFQHRFTCLHDDHPAGGFGGLDATVVALADPIGTLDTGFIVACGPQAWQGFLQYNTGLFEPASAERWAANLATLLASVAAAPATPIGALALLHPDELEFIAASLDRTGAPFAPRHASVHAAFEQQVVRTPDAVALRCGAAQMTYAQLNARADAIAAHLHRLGVGADDLVGICTARGNDMIAAVIGVLKTGAAYVPMDIKYPPLRLEAIAAEAQLRFVLCDERGRGMLDSGADGGSAREVLLADVPAAAPPFASPATGPASLCHVIFTSGSTGKPKGVMAGHHNVLAFLDWIWATYPPEQLRVVLCCSSLCFDLTVFEIWGPLTVGGTVVVVENAVSLVQQQVPDLTLLNTVPTALRLLLDERSLPPGVQAVNVCGEPLDGQLVADLFAQYPHVVFYNTYGPTEDTAYSTFFKMTGPVEGDPPIGIPILHEYGRVMDAHGMAAPVGAVGELLIGGAGVAQGYLYNPQFSAERFLAASDYAGRPSHEYRSGDFVRLRNNGQLQFVGRRDDQIKLRGFRIDLGDVVSALLQVPGVTDARVLVRQHNGGDVLVAYLSHADMPPGGGRDAALTARVEAETNARLPAYMVPACFVLFDRLPLNDNGKVDRHALRAVAFDAGPAAVLQEVWSDDERAIGEVWKAVLAVDRIGRDDDFFQLGGNSLLAVRMISRLNRAFDTNLPSQVVFKDRTVASLAALVRRAVTTEAVPLARADLSGGVSPTYPQLAMLMNADKISFNLCSAMRIDGQFDPAALQRALRRLLQRHDALRARFVMDGPAVRMHIADAPAEILTVLDVPDQAGVNAAVQAEWCLPFDLQAGPPVRALLLRQSDQRHVLVLSIHHVVTDEWSTNIVKRDLARCYRAELAGRGEAEAELPFRYGDYASWQARLHDTDEFARQLAYWTGEFQQVRVEGAFPQGGVPPHGAAPATAYLQMALPASTARQMAALSARHGYTPYVVLMAALQLALAEYSGLEQQLVWSPVARRTEPELEESVGMYTNLMAISARASGDLQLGQFLALIERKVAQSRSNSDLSALTAVMFDPSLMPALPMIGLNFIDLPNETDWAFDGATVTTIPLLLEQEADLCALELTVRAAQATFAYNTALFHDGDLARLAARLWDIIDGFERRPEAAIGAVLAPPPDHAVAVAAAA
ncbi:MAG: amino acid adenylation domain-containing protein [Pseudomonadota bacterium]